MGLDEQSGHTGQQRASELGSLDGLEGILPAGPRSRELLTRCE
jgi:hypothetical protein